MLLCVLKLLIACNYCSLSSIFNRMLPTISKYVYLGEYLSWSVEIKITQLPLTLSFKHILYLLSTFVSFLLLQNHYKFISGCLRKIQHADLGTFSVASNIPRFLELTVATEYNEFVGVDLPVQGRTELAENDFLTYLNNYNKNDLSMCNFFFAGGIFTRKLTQLRFHVSYFCNKFLKLICCIRCFTHGVFTSFLNILKV